MIHVISNVQELSYFPTKKQIVRSGTPYMMMSEGNSVVACHNPLCLGNYDFMHIARFAKKRFVEGFDTIALLKQAKSKREKEEIALVCLLDVEDGVISDLRLDCRHAGKCKATDCRDRLKNIIEQDLAAQNTKPQRPAN